MSHQLQDQPWLAMIVAAAGTGSRMKMGQHKQFATLGGMALLGVTLKQLQQDPNVKEIILVSHPSELARVQQEMLVSGHMTKVTQLIAGGASRRESVEAGLAAVNCRATHIGIHDGARPLVTSALIQRVFQAAQKADGAVPGLPVTDTLKRVDDEGKITDTVSREQLWSVQTPQIFTATGIQQAYERLPREIAPTDDAAVMEAAGFSVQVVTGCNDNIKITVQEDLRRAEAIMESRRRHHENW
ncbi:2-C-methyl-D-erythritol 4-phosphate cytidylyltransferase [Anoxynatronum sibiricum]|uniref:2-C-methyl-D-erythritol 4-phosphate cytidylyltransferase n=1 Tax=Anoxynatronum sibiricum TaxID=210623 RepID=A0ABU9VYD4_9CLOT